METIRAIIEAGADVNAVSDWFGTPLCLAAIRGNLAAVKFLIEHNAIVNKNCKKLGSAAHAACVGGDMATMLALHAAGADWAVSKLICVSALCHLSRLARLDESLVACRIIPDCQSQSPGAVAVRFRHCEAVEFCLGLAEGLWVHETWKTYHGDLELEYDSSPCVACSTDSMSLLSLSMSTLDVRTAESLLNHGARDNLLDPTGRGALAHALDSSRRRFTNGLDLESCVRLLVQHRGDINATHSPTRYQDYIVSSLVTLWEEHNTSGKLLCLLPPAFVVVASSFMVMVTQIPLPASVIGKAISTYERMLKHSIRGSLRTALAYTISCEKHRSRVHCIEVLCNNGANVDLEDSDGRSALDLARIHLKGEELIEVKRILLLHSSMRPTGDESSPTS